MPSSDLVTYDMPPHSSLNPTSFRKDVIRSKTPEPLELRNRLLTSKSAAVLTSKPFLGVCIFAGMPRLVVVSSIVSQ